MKVWGDTAAAEGKYATSLVLDLLLMYQNDARIRRESEISLLTEDQQHLCGGTLPLLATVSPDFESPLMSSGGGGQLTNPIRVFIALVVLNWRVTSPPGGQNSTALKSVIKGKIGATLMTLIIFILIAVEDSALQGCS